MSGLRVHCRCDIADCQETFWANGREEPDVNAMGVCDDDEMEDACEHVKAGGSYTIIDSEVDYGDDDFGLSLEDF